MTEQQEYEPQSHKEDKTQFILNELRGRVTLIGLGISIIETQLQHKSYDEIEHTLGTLSSHYQYLCNLLDNSQQNTSSE
jgi:hypothetical protein